MNERLQRIADELGTSVYIDPTHGRIAKDNFVYGVAQQKLVDIERIDKWLRKNLTRYIQPCSSTREDERGITWVEVFAGVDAQLFDDLKKMMEE